MHIYVIDCACDPLLVVVDRGFPLHTLTYGIKVRQRSLRVVVVAIIGMSRSSCHYQILKREIAAVPHRWRRDPEFTGVVTDRRRGSAKFLQQPTVAGVTNL